MKIPFLRVPAQTFSAPPKSPENLPPRRLHPKRIVSSDNHVVFVLYDASFDVVDKKKGISTAVNGQSIDISKTIPGDELKNSPELIHDKIAKNKRVTLGAFDDGGGFVQVHNPNGKIVAEMQSSKTNTGLIMANDFDGNMKKSLNGN